MIETRKSFCRFCHVFCGVEVDVEVGEGAGGERVVAVRGDRDNPITRGYTCEKGRAEAERIHHAERLRSSRKHTASGWQEIGAQLALDEVSQKLRAIVDEHGPDSVAAYVGCGGHRTSAGGPWYVRRFLTALGSPRMYTSITIDSPSLFLAAHRFFGGVMPTNLFDIDRADVAMFVGSNPLGSHFMSMPQSSPTRRLEDAQRRGMKLVVADPRRSDVARRADVHLQVRPGEDAALLAGMIKLIIERGLYDAEYVGAYGSGLDALGEAVSDFDLDYVSRRTHVPAARIEQAAELFAAAERGGAQSGTGLHMARHQNLSTQLVMTLNGLCGRYDRPGGIVRNRGALSFDLPEGIGPAPIPHFSGPTSRIRGIRGTFSLIGFYDEMPTNTLTDEILTPGEGQVRALIVSGGNPALVFPDSKSTVKALESLDLLVVDDLFMSATAKLADYVIGVKHPFERADVTRLADGAFPAPFAQYTPPIADVGRDTDLVEDWEIFWGLATRMGLDLDIRGVEMSQKPNADQILDGLHANARIPLDEVRKHPSGRIYGEPALSAGGIIPNMIGHEDGRMALGHPELIEELRAVRVEPVQESSGYGPGEDFAFRMITYRMKEVYCTQGQNLPSLAAKRPFNPLLMNPAAMRRLGVDDGDLVEVDSGYGDVEAVVEASDQLAEDVIALAFGWGDPSDERGVREKGSNVQRLIPDDVHYDPVTGLAQQSAVPVNVRPVAG